MCVYIDVCVCVYIYIYIYATNEIGPPDPTRAPDIRFRKL